MCYVFYAILDKITGIPFLKIILYIFIGYFILGVIGMAVSYIWSLIENKWKLVLPIFVYHLFVHSIVYITKKIADKYEESRDIKLFEE